MRPSTPRRIGSFRPWVAASGLHPARRPLPRGHDVRGTTSHAPPSPAAGNDPAASWGPGLDRHEVPEKDRRRRYDTAAGLAADIRRHLDNEPVAARPPSLGYRVQKTVRRHRSAFATAGVVLVALLFGSGDFRLAGGTKSRALERMTEAESPVPFPGSRREGIEPGGGRTATRGRIAGTGEDGPPGE